MNKRMRELLAQASSRPLEAVNQMNSTESDMNKRMRELAFEANKDLDGNMPIGFAEKFAELIVRECAEACEKNSYLALNGWQRAKQILNHFGVDQ